MDFLMSIPKTQRKYDAVWVIIDRFTKSAHFLPIRETSSLEKLAKLYVSEIVRLHGVPVSIVSDAILILLLDFGKLFSKRWVQD